MDLNVEVASAPTPLEVSVQTALRELAIENARLRQLVGELLMKNQRLRELAP